MIPDFPSQKSKLLELWTEYLRYKQRERLGYLATAPHYTHHEGDQWSTKGEDGTIARSDYESIEAEFSVHVNEIPGLTTEEIARKFDGIAEELARQMSTKVLEDIQQAATRVGNAGNRRLTKDAFLEALEHLLLSFDKHGNPSRPTLLIPPELAEEVSTWEQDPDFEHRYSQIIERKREEWRDRESYRKLVD